MPPPESKASRATPSEPTTALAVLMGTKVGFFVTTLMTPPMAPSPYSTEDGPRRTSMRSTFHVSKGKVTVPAPT